MRNEKLIKRREELGLTQQQVSDRAKISIRAYQKYEYGHAKPKVSSAFKIAKVLGATVEQIF